MFTTERGREGEVREWEEEALEEEGRKVEGLKGRNGGRKEARKVDREKGKVEKDGKCR